jgi:hypothetical protein
MAPERGEIEHIGSLQREWRAFAILCYSAPDFRLNNFEKNQNAAPL